MLSMYIFFRIQRRHTSAVNTDCSYFYVLQHEFQIIFIRNVSSYLNSLKQKYLSFVFNYLFCNIFFS